MGVCMGVGMKSNAMLGVLIGSLLLLLASGVAAGGAPRGGDGFDVVSEDCEKEIEYPYTN